MYFFINIQSNKLHNKRIIYINEWFC